MSLDLFARILHVVVRLGLVDVWLLRARSSSPSRGRDAQTLAEEFTAYGRPAFGFYVVGALEISAGVILLAALWRPMPDRPVAIVVAGLMVGAIVMRARVKDPVRKYLPAALLLARCVAIVLLPS